MHSEERARSGTCRGSERQGVVESERDMHIHADTPTETEAETKTQIQSTVRARWRRCSLGGRRSGTAAHERESHCGSAARSPLAISVPRESTRVHMHSNTCTQEQSARKTKQRAEEEPPRLES
jgi:hypothetical protein